MIRAATFVLRPTKGQERKLEHLLAQQRYLYNAARAERIAAWKDGKRRIGKYDQFRSLNGLAVTNPTLAQYGIVVSRGTLTRLDLAFGEFFRRCREGKPGEKPGYPRHKGPDRWDSVSYPAAGSWKFDADTDRLRLLGIGHIKVRRHRDLPGRPKTLTVRRRGKRWEVTVFCDQVPPRVLEPTGRQVGIDLGLASILTTSEGEHLANPRFARKAAERLAVAQRDLERKVKWSGRRKKAVQRVAANHRKVANCRKDLAHQTSRRLVDAFDLIAHEDLRIANMVLRPAPRPNEEGGFDPNGATAKAGMNRSIQDAGWGQLLRFIAYKAEEAGREVIAVDPRNTSRTCSSCGHCEKENRPNQATFLCLACGYVAHADENAAVNILRAGLALRDAAQAAERVVQERDSTSPETALNNATTCMSHNGAKCHPAASAGNHVTS